MTVRLNDGVQWSTNARKELVTLFACIPASLDRNESIVA
jgi:hypothetical protein